ncbi:VPA1262 family N-terminal domain-containing protein [Fictibacillus sp. B-59209]|uniref:VPA1262 family N-terminal domain-containing protein n=1 Tax=Fictibacillus sp. B-59209 TaxID=3024873 RepID=UPI002E1A459C|nr:VPA1262 family N-terminal domain-containing protein [Fictibacillus sp. B-59209]
MLKQLELDDIAKDYVKAEITTMWLTEKIGNRETNILTVVELIPEEQEHSDPIQTTLPDGTILEVARRNISQDRTVYISRQNVTTLEGLAFYRSAKINNSQLTIHGKTFILKTAAKLTEEPANETTALIPSNLSESSSLGAVLPKRRTSMRVCTLVDVNQKTESLFTAKEFENIGMFAKEFLDIDLLKFSEFVGSFLLCFPNPILRKIEERLSKHEDQIIVEMFERNGKSIVGGWIELSDERPSAKGFTIFKQIDAPRLLVNIPCSPHRLRTRVFSAQGEIIEDNAAHFIKSINTNLALMGTKRQVNIRDSKTDKIETYEIDVLSNAQPIFKESDQQTPEQLLKKGDERRALDALEQNRIFMYFPGNSEDSVIRAKSVVRELLGNVKERCIICDPYLSGDDVIQYALFVRYSNIPVRLISSVHFLREKINRDDAFSKLNAERMTEVLTSLSKQDSTLNINCRALLGKDKSPLHDRFMVIDEQVYLLGSSLNEFGSRATTLFRAPDPRPLVGAAENWWRNEQMTIDVGEWLERHNKRRGDK